MNCNSLIVLYSLQTSTNALRLSWTDVNINVQTLTDLSNVFATSDTDLTKTEKTATVSAKFLFTNVYCACYPSLNIMWLYNFSEVKSVTLNKLLRFLFKILTSVWSSLTHVHTIATIQLAHTCVPADLDISCNRMHCPVKFRFCLFCHPKQDIDSPRLII